MKPAPFAYHRPQSVDAVFDCFERLDGEVSLLAGGQSLGPMLNLRLARPAHLVDLNDLVEFDYVRDSNGAIEIGGLTRQHRLATDTQIGAALPLLAAGAASIGHYAIRQRGTLGGSLAHADPAAQLPLLAVLMDAEIICVSRAGEREIKADDFFQSIMTTALMPGEVVVGARFPKPLPAAGWGFELFSRRQGDFAIVATGALVALDAGRVADLKLAVGGAGPRPIRLDAEVKQFLNQAPDAAWLEAVGGVTAKACAAEEDARISATFRKDLVRALVRRAVAAAIARARKFSVMTKQTIMLTVNGENREASVEPRRLLSDVLRDDLGLTGTHVGCEHGVCGACTVLVDGRPTRACLTFAVQMEGHEITTIEAIGADGRYSPLQRALHEEHGLQCGFCTPGIIMTFEAYLRDHADATEAEIREVLSGNLCRCTGYQNIVAAVHKAAAVMRGGCS